MAAETRKPRLERRRRDQMIFVERRRGKLWMYGQMALLALLLFLLYGLVR